MTHISRIASAAFTAALLAAMILAAAVLVPSLFGLDRYVVTGASMTGTYDRGSIVFDRAVPVNDLKVGDVITYAPPAGTFSSAFVTHRIIRITKAENGAPLFQTKGDANQVEDPWTFTLDSATQARVAYHLPYVGYALGAFNLRWVRLLVFVIPALLIALRALAGLWREAGAHARTELEAGAK